jgi:hypothetical protein
MQVDFKIAYQIVLLAFSVYQEDFRSTGVNTNKLLHMSMSVTDHVLSASTAELRLRLSL